MPNLFALPFQVKICGLTSPQQAADAVAAGADAIGLNFYEPSVRYITEKEAVLIANTTIDGRTKCPVVGSSFDLASEIIDSVRNNVFLLFSSGFGAEMRS